MSRDFADSASCHLETSHAVCKSFTSLRALALSPCRGAASGEGLGNAFLSHITAVDGIFHVCRGFEVR